MKGAIMSKCADRDKLTDVERIANNALYFDYSPDYGSALWEILGICRPEMEEAPELEFMEEE